MLQERMGSFPEFGKRWAKQGLWGTCHCVTIFTGGAAPSRLIARPEDDPRSSQTVDRSWRRCVKTTAVKAQPCCIADETEPWGV